MVTAAIASATDIPLTTVASWNAANFIPSWRQGTLLHLALEKGEPLSTADFPPPESRRSRKAKAA